MAYLVAKQSGAFNDAATWNMCTPPATDALLDATTTNSFSSTTKTVYSDVFTAPNTSAQCIGAVFFIQAMHALWTGSITLKLQEFNGSAWVDKATEVIDVTTLPVRNPERAALYIKFATPYSYATTSTGYYRFQYIFTNTQGTYGGAVYINSSSNVCTLAVDDRTGAPGTTDDVVVVGEMRSSLQVEVLLSGSVEFGGLKKSAPSFFSGFNPSFRWGCTVSLNGKISTDTAVTNSLYIKGQIVNAEGEISFGSVDNHITATNPLLIEFDMGVAGGIFHWRGTLSMVGESKAVRREYSSGAGTAASPLVIDAAASDWAVGDELLVTQVGTDGANNYNNCQYRYIIALNSPTSFVVSATQGGAEAALTNTRSYANGNAHVVNLSRSIILRGKSGTGANYLQMRVGDQVVTSFYAAAIRFTSHIEQVRFESMGFTDIRPVGTSYSGNVGQSLLPFTFDGNVFYAPQSNMGFQPVSMGINDFYQFSDITFCKSTSSSFYLSMSGNFFECLRWNFIDNQRGGITVSSLTYATLDDFVMAALNKENSSSNTAYQLYFSSACLGSVIRNLKHYSCRGSSNMLLSSPIVPDFYDSEFNYRGYSSGFTINILNSGGGIARAVRCKWGNGNKYSQNAGYAIWAEVDRAGVAWDNYYSDPINNVLLVPTGAGLADTNVRTENSKAISIKALFSSALGGVGIFSFYVLAPAGKAVNVFGYAKKAAALVGLTAKARITLPFSSNYAAEVTLTDDTNWNLWSLSADYSAGTITSLARIDIIVPYISSGYLYLDDIMNGTNAISALDMMFDARPSPIMVDQIGDPGAVWAYANSGHPTGSMGEFANKLNSNVINTQGLVMAQ